MSTLVKHVKDPSEATADYAVILKGSNGRATAMTLTMEIPGMEEPTIGFLKALDYVYDVEIVER